MKSANIYSIKCEFSEYLFDKTEHPDWLQIRPKRVTKGLAYSALALQCSSYKHAPSIDEKAPRSSIGEGRL